MTTEEQKPEQDAAIREFLENLPQIQLQQQLNLEKLLNIDETADLLNVNRRLLDNWRWQKIGPPWVKFSGRMIRYRLSDITHWIEEQTVRP